MERERKEKGKGGREVMRLRCVKFNYVAEPVCKRRTGKRRRMRGG